MPTEWTPKESVRWLLSFSKFTEQSLADARPGDVPNLLFDLRRYLRVEPEDEKVEQELSRAEREPRVLLGISGTVRDLLMHVADKVPFRYRYNGGELVFDASKLPDDGALSYHDAGLADAVVQVAVDDLSDEAALRVKRCANPKCSEIFFADRRSQIYCGHRCANLVVSRKYREREEIKQKRRAHAKKKYRERSTSARK